MTQVWLNYYRMPLKLKGWAQKDLKDDFMIDYRNTADPEIEEDFITFSFMGELFYTDSLGAYDGCFDLSPKKVRPLKSDFSQLVITDAAATCIAEAVQKSKLGKFILNERTLNELMGTTDLKWDTNHLKQKIPILANKIGDDIPLEFELSYRDMKIEIPYERNDIDVHAGFVLRLIMRYDEKDPRFKEKGLTQTELFYDELKMITKYDLDIQEDVLLVDMKALQFDIDKRYGFRDMPMRNNLDMTPEEYKELIGQTQLYFNFIRRYFNDVALVNGVPFPYSTKEFYTSLDFAENAMYFIFEVEDTAAYYLEEDGQIDEVFDWFD